MAEKVVVAGAGFGGVNAAVELARKGFDVKILDKNSFSEFTPGLIDLFRNRVSEEKLKLHLNDFFGNTDVEFFQEKILGVNIEEKKVETDSGSHSYDYLVLALGSEAATYGMDVSDAETCYGFRDAEKLERQLEDAEDAIIVGAGYVGVEIATELEEDDIDVTLVDGSTRPVATADFETSETVLDHLNDQDINFRGGSNVEEVNSDSVRLETGDTVEADVVIWSGGLQASSIVQESFDTGKAGLPVNSGLSSKQYKDVFAVGDCADSGAMKLAQNAGRQGVLVAENVAKSEVEALEEYSEGNRPLLIGLGNTAVLSYGDTVLKNRFFRYMKDWVRVFYRLQLKKRKLKLRLGL